MRQLEPMIRQSIGLSARGRGVLEKGRRGFEIGVRVEIGRVTVVFCGILRPWESGVRAKDCGCAVVGLEFEDCLEAVFGEPGGRLNVGAVLAFEEEG